MNAPIPVLRTGQRAKQFLPIVNGNLPNGLSALARVAEVCFARAVQLPSLS